MISKEAGDFMSRWWTLFCVVVLGLTVTVALTFAQAVNSEGWQVPADAAQKKNPLEASAKVIDQGKSLFKNYCQRCHGATGVGDGPDADPDHKPGNLTDASRAASNPDGVMYYKIWNGRKQPRMPAFKNDLTENEVWAIIRYATTLRKPS